MIFECSLVALITCVIALLSVGGNKLCLWQSWLMCAAGGLTFTILLSMVTTLSPLAAGLIMALLATLLRWLGREYIATVANEPAIYEGAKS